MKDKVKIILDSYDIGIIINSLQLFKDSERLNDRDISPINELLERLIDEGERKKILRIRDNSYER